MTGHPSSLMVDENGHRHYIVHALPGMYKIGDMLPMDEYAKCTSAEGIVYHFSTQPEKVVDDAHSSEV